MIDLSMFDDIDVTLPGLVVAIASSGALVVSASRGSAVPNGDRIDEHSRFYAASIAKQFTAASIAALALDGTVELDQPVRQFVPELHPSFDPVLLHHLLAHTGGLRDSNDVDAEAGWSAHEPCTTWDRVATIAATELESRPGMVHRYSNHGYVLLAAVVERATDMSFGLFARRTLLEPAQMTASRFLDTPGADPVPGWSARDGRVDVGFSCSGDGGLVTTVQDLAHWDTWLPASPLAPLMLTDRALLPNGALAHDAWGISIRPHHGVRIESHGGAIDGYMASFIRFPTAEFSIILLANTDRFGIAGFGRRARSLADSLLGERLDPTQPPWTETHGQRVP